VVRRHVLEYQTSQRYDGIRHMGVTEHLPNYKATCRKYAELVKPGGAVYLDALAMRAKTSRLHLYERYIYPGESSPLLAARVPAPGGASPFELVSVDDDRHNYYLTCREWRAGSRGPDEVVHRWGDPPLPPIPHLLWGSAAGFDTGLVQAYRWVLACPTTA